MGYEKPKTASTRDLAAVVKWHKTFLLVSATFYAWYFFLEL